MIEWNHCNRDTSQNSKVCRLGFAVCRSLILNILGIFSLPRGQETKGSKTLCFLVLLLDCKNYGPFK